MTYRVTASTVGGAGVQAFDVRLNRTYPGGSPLFRSAAAFPDLHDAAARAVLLDLWLTDLAVAHDGRPGEWAAGVVATTAKGPAPPTTSLFPTFELPPLMDAGRPAWRDLSEFGLIGSPTYPDPMHGRLMPGPPRGWVPLNRATWPAFYADLDRRLRVSRAFDAPTTQPFETFATDGARLREFLRR